jgi:hypothetical protein
MYSSWNVGILKGVFLNRILIFSLGIKGSFHTFLLEFRLLLLLWFYYINLIWRNSDLIRGRIKNIF